MIKPHASAQTLRVLLPDACEGERLDKAIAMAEHTLSRATIQRLLKTGEVTRLDGSQPKTNAKAKAGETFLLHIPLPEAIEAQPEDIPLEVIYEDDHIIVINKPAGLAVHAGAGRHSGVLVNALLHHCGGPEQKGGLSGIGGAIRPGIVHRLDMETSGLLVAAKNDQAHLHLAAQFATHAAYRGYQAVVKGVLTTHQGSVNAPIGRNPTDRKKMAVEPRHGRHAVTHWQRLETLPGFTLISCRLETGRTHQIRVHMAHIGHPVLGDPLYARTFNPPINWPESVRERVISFRRQALHAAQLTITHPTTAQEMRFTIDPPEDFRQLLTSLRSVSP
ncbi:MAG: RluA family pseudouridine synthase [Magnetococcales bacterium]|nr:RluA family pseudouridine synthase [Magnetococcales bacterium]MBF0439347.1 RluA family pseudouridine synthase [Magnetococcales bacterium]